MRSSRQGSIPVARSGASVLWILMLLGPAVVLAQPSLGVRVQAAQPDELAPDGGCDVAPRSFEDVSQLMHAGRLAQQVTSSSEANASTRRGKLVDVRAVLMQFVACSG